MEFQIILFLIFGVMALIRALSRNAQEQQQPQAQAGRPDRRRKVQNDIDDFLAEVSQTSGNRPRGTRAGSSAAGSKSRPRRARSQQQRPQRRKPQRRQQPRPKQVRAEVQPSSLRDESSARSLGSGISEHVDTYISQHVADHIDSKVDDYVEVDIVESVDRRLGSRDAEMPVTADAMTDDVTPADQFRQLLSSRQGIRQAILLNEVLQRPRILRR